MTISARHASFVQNQQDRRMPLADIAQKVIRRAQLTLQARRVNHSADALLASYPKCGRTWFRFILANYFAYQLGGAQVDMEGMFSLAPNLDLDPVRGLPAFHRRGADIPLIAATHEEYNGSHPTSLPIVFMIRDPRDVMVSAYFHATRHKQFFVGDIDTFIRGEHGLARYIRYINGWATALTRHKAFTISYEALSADPQRTTRDALRFLGLPAPEEAVAHAVTASSFSNLQRLEQAQGIPGHRYDRTDPDALRIRRGQVGGYRDHLGSASLEAIETICAAQLNKNGRNLVRGYFANAGE